MSRQLDNHEQCLPNHTYKHVAMLANTFVHLPAVGPETERRLWRRGITTPDAFLNAPPQFISPARRQKMEAGLRLTRDKLALGDARYFYAHLPPREHWRLFQEYRGVTAYLDIETTGFGGLADIITSIALYDGQTVRWYVNGDNLTDFPADIAAYKVIVTYNGKLFDVPVIERFFGIQIDQAHIDLRYVLRGLGYSGGLKSCERQLGIGRGGSLAEVDGYFAVLLWHDYRHTGALQSLETLLAYNIEDAVNLEHLMVRAYNLRLRNIPLDLPRIAHPVPPPNPFRVDEATVRRLQRYQIWQPI